MRRRKVDWQALGLALLVLLVGGTLLAAVSSGVPVPSVGGAAPNYSSSLQVSRPSREAAIAAMEQLTNPSDILSAQGLQITLGTSNLPSQDPVVRYMQALSNFSSSIRQIQSGVQVAQALASSGNENEALLIVNRLGGLRNETGTLIATMYSTLDLVKSEPNVNQGQIQVIRQRLDGLRRVFIEYSIEIDELRSQVTPRTVSLSVSVSTSSVFVNQPMVVSGRLLTRNGTAMAQRNITISWADSLMMTETDATGSYNATIVFHPGYPNGTAVIVSSFHPAGSDARQFVTTNATTLTELEYYPTQIVAEISPRTALPLDPVSVTGNLITALGVPLENRTLRFQFDGDILGEAGTGINGAFAFNFQTPPFASDGNHTLQVLFLPNAEVFASAAMDLPFVVQREQTEISAVPSLNVLLSGMSLGVAGSVSFAPNAASSEGTFRGNVTFLVDGTSYGRSTVADNGAYSLSATIPLGLGFGKHAIEIVYLPLNPRMDGSIRTGQVFVYNSELVAIVALAAVVAPQLVVIRGRRRRRLRVRSLAAEGAEEPLIALSEAKPPMSRSDWDAAVKSLAKERNASRKVVMCYRLAQNLVCNNFGENLNDTETHWEFYKRVVGLKPLLAPDLRRLAELFELAEYSQYLIHVSYGDEAEDRLLKIRDADWS